MRPPRTQFWLDFGTVQPDSNDVPDRELAARIRELSEQLKGARSSVEALAPQVAEAIRQERRAGQPRIAPETDPPAGE
jgi:hypothetical protein